MRGGTRRSVASQGVDERSALEEQLRERDARLQLAEELAGIGIWDIDVASDTVRGTTQFFRIMGLEPTPNAIPMRVLRSLRLEQDRGGVSNAYKAAIDANLEVCETEYRIRLPGGDIRWISGRGRIIRDASGSVVRYSGVDFDITERKHAQETADRLAAIVRSSDDAIVSKDLNGIVVTWNDGATRLFGYSAAEMIGRSITLIIPEDRQDEEPRVLERIRAGKHVDHYETVRQRKDGSLLDVSLTVSPLRDASGLIVGASKIARDITERRRAQAQQDLLLREMRHRVKNLFAVTSSIVSLSARNASSPAEMASAIQGRLGALTRAHELTRPGLIEASPSEAQDTTLHALIRAILSPYSDPSDGRRLSVVKIRGPDTAVQGDAITGLALILYELATNAAKYGALSAPGGHVSIECSQENDTFGITWKEHGGPPLAGAPETEGFGGTLTKRLVEAQFGGSLSHDWTPGGLIARMVIPVSRL
jgi:PAS domain S-box-containing protein